VSISLEEMAFIVGIIGMFKVCIATKRDGAASLSEGIAFPGNCVRVVDPPDVLVVRGS
jgi:hypothetical protein